MEAIKASPLLVPRLSLVVEVVVEVAGRQLLGQPPDSLVGAECEVIFP